MKKRKIKTGIELITEKRLRQLTTHGHSVDMDREHNKEGQLLEAAQKLIQSDTTPILSAPKGWNKLVWQELNNKSYGERLVIAGAFIAAEIDRLLPKYISDNETFLNN